ncbi:MAG: hypothetical protein WBP58_17735 [Chitinophagaceae bacterium]
MKKQKTDPGQARLLDHWNKPDHSGAPVGCITTTFTFQSDFFEEECLPRFLDMESNVEDGIVYIVEREEKLNSVDCVAVWLDQAFAKQVRNMRWDLMPYRISQGIMHAKITVLRWTRHLRILVGSANVTDTAYRKNREIMVALDINENIVQDKPTIVSLLNTMLDWLSMDTICAEEVRNRSRRFLNANIEFLKTLPDPSLNLRNQEHFSYPVIIRPGRPALTEQVSEIWKQHFGDVGPSYAYVVSPFFDAGGNRNLPTEKTWEIMKKKGNIKLKIYTSGDKDMDKKPLRLHAPESIKKTLPNSRSGVSLEFYLIDPSSREDNTTRQLHSKIYYFENDREQFVYILGSSNFTTKGLGLSVSSNIEANIAIVSDAIKYPDFYKVLDNAWPSADDVNTDTIKWEPSQEEESDLLIQEPALPAFFQSATIKQSGTNLVLEIKLNDDNAPNEFTISTPHGNSMNKIISHNDWLASGKPLVLLKDIPQENLPSYLLITWKDIEIPATMPVNIEDQSCLPPPEDLANLPLEVLTELITSAKPIHSILRKYFQRQADQEKFQGIDLDPLKKYSSSTHILQRTRKYSLAINQLKNRLEMPFPTEKALEWKLYGPVGIMVAIDSIAKESVTKSEAVFFLSEIWKTLGGVKPSQENGTLPVNTIQQYLDEFREKLNLRVTRLWEQSENHHITEYSRKILQTF